MKLLFFIDSLSSGGAQNQIVNLSIGLSELGYEIDLVTYYSLDFFAHRIEGYKNINHIRLEKKNKLGVNVILNLIKLVNRNDYRIALSYLETPNFYLSIAKIFTKRTTTFITSERNTTDVSRKKLLIQKKITHKLSDYLICNSFHEADLWKKILPTKVKQITTIYNGVQLDRFKYIVKKEYKTYKMLCVASVIPRKNAIYIANALFILKNEYNIKLEFTWIGQYMMNGEENEYYKKVNLYLKELGIEDQWKWKGPIREIEKIYKNYDGLILASIKEGVPNVICESFSIGLPVFAGNILDHPYLLSEPQRGFLFDLDNPKTLAMKIRNFYELSDAEIAEISMNQRKYSEQELALSVMINRYDNFFKSI